MDTLLQMGVSNAFMATILALLAAGIGRLCRRPALLHCLWLIVLLKLITPSVIVFPIPWPDGSTMPLKAVSTPEATAFDTPLESEQNAETRQTDGATADLSDRPSTPLTV